MPICRPPPQSPLTSVKISFGDLAENVAILQSFIQIGFSFVFAYIQDASCVQLR